MLTGKTIGQLTYLETPTADTLIPVELSGATYHIDFSSITVNGGGVVETTYSELYDKVTGGTLTIGSYYLITDFQTCYDQPDYDYNRNSITSGNYKTAEIDPIIVFATSSTTLSENAYQPSYPNDSIKYDISFTVTERTGSPAKGRITERIDEFNNRTDYDHRTILFKRYRYYEINFDNPYQGTVEVFVSSATEMVVSGTGTNFLSIGGVGSKVGFDVSYNDYKIYEITNITSDTEMTITGLTNTILSSGIRMCPADWDEYSSFYQNNVDDPSLFEEYYTFDFEDDNNNNYIGNHANLYQSNENDFILANNVFYNRFRGNKFGHSCYNNSFFDDCDDNIVGNYFYNNITDDDFDRNVIGNNFYYNKITANFQSNRIGESFNNNYIVQNSFYRNNIGNGFEYNQISGDDFQNNEIGNQFQNNKIRNGQFYKNDIGNGFNDNNIFWNFYGNLIGNGFNENDIYCPFYDNVISDYYESNNLGDINDPSNNEFYENRIGYSCYANNITAQTYNNIIGNDFDNNTITSQLYDNIIGNNFSNNTIDSDFHNNKIFNNFKGNLITDGGNFEFNTTGWGFSGNQLSGYCGGNIFGTLILDNDFFGDVSSNNIENFFAGNVIGDEFVNNKIGNYCQNNTIGIEFQNNVIGSNFQSNTIDDGFGFGGGSYQGNKIGNNFSQNTIGEYFYNNTIPDNFYNNTIGEYFQWNIVDTWINGVDFTFYYGNVTAFTYTSTSSSATDGVYIDIGGTTNGNGVNATFDVEVLGGSVVDVTGNTQGQLYICGDTITILGTQIGGTDGVDDVVITVAGVSITPSVYEGYTCNIFKNSGNVNRLSYYDESDVLTIKNINE